MSEVTPENAIKLIGRMASASNRAAHSNGNSKSANQEEDRAAAQIFKAIVGRLPNADERELIHNACGG